MVMKLPDVLKKHFQTSFSELDNLPPKELQKIRESFLGYYRGSVEKAEKLKKWVIGVNSHNQYTDIDNLFYNSGDVLHLENKVRSKNVIIEGLKKSTITSVETK